MKYRNFILRIDDEKKISFVESYQKKKRKREQNWFIWCITYILYKYVDKDNIRYVDWNIDYRCYR